MDQDPLEDRPIPEKTLIASDPGLAQSALNRIRRNTSRFDAGKLLTSLSLIGLVLYTTFFLYRAVVLIGYPYTADYGEPYLLNQATMISRMQSPYQPIELSPFVIANYTPLFPTVLAPFVKVFGAGYWYGRLLATLATLGTALVVGLLVFGATGHKTPSLLAALSLLSFYHYYEWGAYSRVDALAVFLVALGLLLVDKGCRIYIYLPFFVAAFFTRQTMLAGAVATLAILWTTERRSEARRFALSFVLCLAVVGLALNAVTRGQFFLHTVVYNANLFSVRDMFLYLLHLARYSGFYCAFGLAYFVFVLSEGRRSLAMYFLVFSFLAGLMCGKVGAAPNYWFEFIVALCWSLGLLWGECHEIQGRGGRVLHVVLASFLLLQIAANFHLPRTRYDYSQTPTRETRNNQATVLDYVKSVSGDVLCHDGALALLAGKEILYQPFEFSQLIYQGLWDENLILEPLAARRFDLLVLPFDLSAAGLHHERFTPGFIQTARANYETLRRINDSYLHTPVGRKVFVNSEP